MLTVLGLLPFRIIFRIILSAFTVSLSKFVLRLNRIYTLSWGEMTLSLLILEHGILSVYVDL